jgi:hypothetical protein
MSTRLLSALSLLGLLALPACTGTLPVPQIVLTPRILSIIADQPEAHPGDDVQVRAFMFDPMGRALRYEWRACVSLESLLGSSSIPSGLPEEPCFAIESDGDRATVPGERTQEVVDQLTALGNIGGFDVRYLLGVLNTAGFAFTVEVDVYAGEELLASAFKRVGVTTRDVLTTNPDPIAYDVGGTLVAMHRPGIGEVGFDGSHFDCIVWGAPIVVAPESETLIAPMGEPSDWIETFPIFNYSGGITEGTENAYYSFYATAGAITEETTRLPDRDVTFTAPLEPGPVQVFLAVRDGHLGARICTFELTVAGP